LNQPSVRERLKQALVQSGFEVELQVAAGSVTDSPSLRLAAKAALAQQEAEAIIMNDPFVQQVMRDFGGKIVPGTLKAVSQVS
jgi:DNA polymerase-3 subunit gamma/tau